MLYRIMLGFLVGWATAHYIVPDREVMIPYVESEH